MPGSISFPRNRSCALGLWRTAFLLRIGAEAKHDCTISTRGRHRRASSPPGYCEGTPVGLVRTIPSVFKCGMSSKVVGHAPDQTLHDAQSAWSLPEAGSQRENYNWTCHLPKRWLPASHNSFLDAFPRDRQAMKECATLPASINDRFRGSGRNSERR